MFALGMLVLVTVTGLPASLPPSNQDLRAHVRNTLRALDAKGNSGTVLCASPLAASSCDWSFEGGPEALRQLLDIGLACCALETDERKTANEVVPQLERVLADLAARVRECLVCLDAPRATYLQPCNHAVACAPCAAALLAQRAPCPVCRAGVATVTAAREPIMATFVRL